MAIRPDYMVGTITLTSGSKNFTTAGASLQSANVTGGDTIMTADGRVLIIDKVTGQNAGTLRNNSPISTSNVALVIRYQPDGSKYQGAMRDLLERWGLTGNIDAIAGLETAKDMLAYFTGAGTANVTALTEWARTLLAAANGGKGYEALGGVPNASLPDRLKDFGLIIANVNTVVQSGWYRVEAGSTGAPENASMILFHLGFSATQARQIIMRHTTNAIYERARVNGTWTEWDRVATKKDVDVKLTNPNGTLAQFIRGNGTLQSVVGTATQAAGGPIIHRGSNANGEFVRYVDGTQICWKSRIEATNPASGYTIAASWTFPAQFINVGSTAGAASMASPNGAGAPTNDNARASGVVMRIDSVSSAAVGVIGVGLTAGTVVEMNAIAIGRWF